MSKPHGNKEFWLAGLRTEGAAFRAAAGQDGALTRPVPSCPGWTVDDLVGHLAGIYRFVASHAGRGVTSAPEDVDRTKPTDLDILAWWDREFAGLVGLLDGLDPGTPAWNWAPQTKKGEFWHRRMAHETAVHRWDAQMAVGLPEPIEAKLAADGVTEVLDTWLPAGRRTGPLDTQGVVGLHATDVEEIWDVRLRGQGVALLDTDTLLDDHDHHERALASGTASDLLLALWGRVPFEVLDTTGEPSLLEALRTAG